MEARLAYHHSPEVDWEDEACVGWFSYIGLSGRVFKIPTRAITTGKKAAKDVQVKK